MKKIRKILHKMVKELLSKDIRFFEEDYDEVFDEEGRIATSTNKGDDYIEVLEKTTKCLHEHVSCPGDIKTIRCAYCGKSMYKEPKL